MSRKLKCKAKSKRTGRPCRAYAMNGRDLCRMHGGATARGYGLSKDSVKRHKDNHLAYLVARSLAGERIDISAVRSTTVTAPRSKARPGPRRGRQP